MRRACISFLAVAFVASYIATPAAAEVPEEPVGEWNFTVYLDDKKVGTHQFEIVAAGEQRRVQSVADFKVKFLFISAYSYEHTNTERWSDDCLVEFNADTRINGKRTSVSGVSSNAGFTVRKNAAEEVLPDCVMTFAYWNPEFLKQKRLLNPQTGEFVDVEVEQLGDAMLEIRGQAVAAELYKVTARDIDLLLWYSDDEEWLALESIAKTGHRIRYELS